uniref:vitamin-K-epoxide reductase (warfarin-sensitive) n=1 Tax=Caligus rogercresseyi TaxID=217165 RepID=C1BQT3_CALRO|nr:Vitamin K epoxide reductase complex subunit 1-like protein 1 [Caligus rogercresseyi]
MSCSKVLSLILCVAGLTATLLTYYVEVRKKETPDAEVLCDLSPEFNCSAVLTSPYAVGFGVIGPFLGEDHILNVPNALYGIAFYLVMILFSLITSVPLLAKLQFLFVLLINLLTPPLAYIMLFVIKKYCVFCIAAYVINVGLLITSFCKKRALSGTASRPYFKVEGSSSQKNEPRLPFDFKKNI